MAIWALCRVVQMAVHFFVNFNVLNRCILLTFGPWVYLQQTWGFCKAWYALYDYVDQYLLLTPLFTDSYLVLHGLKSGS